MTPLTLALLKIAALVAPLALLAWAGRTYPDRLLVRLAVLPAAATIGLPLTPWMLAPVLLMDLLLAAGAVIDLFSLPRRRDFSVTRETGRVASLAKRHRVRLSIVNRSTRACTVSVRDDAAPILNPDPPQFDDLEMPARSRIELEYGLRPGRRGAFELAEVFLRVRSRWSLWQKLMAHPEVSHVNVYPDMQQLGQYAILARTNRLSQLGVRRTRRIGQDHDFERLRDYAVDDNYKHIDWRATARRRKLTVKDYQATRSQRVIFLVDCGRMMTNTSAGLSLLDHAFNAMLMLSWVALRQSDTVGLCCFSDEIHGFVPARGGMGQMNRLLHACFNRFPRRVESRYDQAFRFLATHARKRSLVVLITNVIDEVNANQVERYLTNLVGRHLPLGVLLRDHRLFDAVEPELPVGDDLWRAAAAADILAWRHQVLTDMMGKGAMMLDVFPEEMTAPLINRYLEVKARHLL
ncbi:MAG: DUF58 domain-containing protein [Thermoguttaceae bacterium]